MDRIGNTGPEITSGTPAGRPDSGTAAHTNSDPHPYPDPYVVAAAAESAEANHDFAPAAEFLGRLLGGGH